MKEISFDELDSIIKSYIEKTTKERPLLIWTPENAITDKIIDAYQYPVAFRIKGHPYCGHDKMIAEGKVARKIIDAERQEIVIEDGVSSAQFVLYNDDFNGLNRAGKLDYCIDLVKLKNIPVVCVVPTYLVRQMKKKNSFVGDQFLDDNFEQLYVQR